MSDYEDDVVAEDPTDVQPSLDSGPGFIDQAYLSYLVPSETNIDVSSVFGSIDRTKPILESIEQRETLFFGKKPNV